MSRYDEQARPARSPFQLLEERLGRMVATVFCAVCLWYLLAHTAVFARLWAELLRAYFAPGALTAALCVLPFLIGSVCSGRRRKTGCRVGRYLECILFVLCASLVWLAGEQIPVRTLYDETVYSGRLDAVFPGISAALPGIVAGDQEIVPALLLLAGLLIATAGGVRCVRTACGYLFAASEEFLHRQVFHGMRERFWEVREKAEKMFDADTDAGMSGAPVANGMITETQKLYQAELADELSVQADGRKPKFYGIKTEKKLPGLPDIGKIRLYGGKIAGELNAARIGWWTVLLALYALTVGFADAFAAVTFYRAYNLQILIPVMLALYLYILLSPRFGSDQGRRS